MWSIRQCHAQRGHWAALLSDGGMDCHTTPPEGGGRLRRDKCSHRAQEISNTPETGSRAPASPENIVEHRVHNGDGLLQASLGPSFPSPEGWSFQPEDRGFTCPHRVSREGVQGWRLRVLVQADLDPLCCPREGGLSSLGSRHTLHGLWDAPAVYVVDKTPSTRPEGRGSDVLKRTERRASSPHCPSPSTSKSPVLHVSVHLVGWRRQRECCAIPDLGRWGEGWDGAL